MNPWRDRENAKRHAISWDKQVRETCDAYITKSIETSRIFEENPSIDLLKGKSNGYDTNIKVVQATSVEAIFDVEDKDNICVLNFASYKNPGGMYIDGSVAQEECLCHYSTLYPVLSNNQFMNDFYLPNRKNLNRALYHSRLIYSPDIVFYPETKQDKPFRRLCDVITCAAPNKKAAQQYQKVSNEEVEQVMKDRIMHILYAASEMDVKTLILGAFGCGVFGNDNVITAKIFNDCINKNYVDTFKTIIFAIPDTPTLNDFKRGIVEK